MKVLLYTPVVGVLALSILLFAAVRTVRAEEPVADYAATPSVYEKKEQGVLVLEDGGVLEGKVEQVGERYKVIRGGSEVEVSASRVQFACGSLSEAYERRRKRMGQPTADAHFELCEWCLRYSLFEEAAKEIEAARNNDPGHPKLRAIERRLTYARDRKNQPAPAPQPKSKPPETPAAAPTQPSPAIGSLPNTAVERFTRKVQPILVNNCTAGGCHQMGGKQQFKLDRALLHGLANRRSTMHNLSATLALVDQAQPHLSQLLVVPRSTHGGMKDPVFGTNDEAEIRHVMDWVALVTNTEAEKDALPAQTQPTAEKADAAATADVGFEDLNADYAAEESLFKSRQVVQIGAQAAKWQPRDEFDPEIFNRQTKSRNTPTPVAPTASGADSDDTP